MVTDADCLCQPEIVLHKKQPHFWEKEKKRVFEPSSFTTTTGPYGKSKPDTSPEQAYDLVSMSLCLGGALFLVHLVILYA